MDTRQDGRAQAWERDMVWSDWAWPGGHRSALVVSIDVDGVYGEINHHGPDDSYWRSQAEYDLTAGVPRLLRLLEDRDVPATFCWVGRCVEDRPDLVRASAAAGHEQSLHSWEHRYYTPMSLTEQLDDMQRTLDAIERLSGTRPTGHKTPAWRYNAETTRACQQMGLRWRMDEAAADLPWIVQPDPSLAPLVELPPSRFFDDYTYFVDWTVSPRDTFDCWRDDVDVLRDEGGLLCLTLHPWVSGRPGPSQALARLLDYVIDLGDVWVARADEVATLALERFGVR